MPCEEFAKKIDIYKNIRRRKKLFGSGFRGIVNKEITAIMLIKRVGGALATYLGEGKTIAIGKDTRISSPILEEEIIEGIIENGCNALTLGITTPNALSLETAKQADAGVMITASHIPPEYNGIKCLSKSGRSFSPEEDIALEKIYFGELKTATKKGKRTSDVYANDRYRAHIVEYVTKLFPIKHMKIVVDGSGGSASSVTPETLEDLGHTVVRFNCEYDGLFKERNPEPTNSNLKKLKRLTIDKNADFGVAHDGDGDRTAFVDENGEFVQGDVSATIIADHILRQNKDKNKTIAVTIAFSNIIKNVATALGANVIYTPVGEPYLAQAKLLCGAQVGLEEHGSVLLEWSREGPMLAGIMAGILAKEENTLSELVASYPKYYQIKDSKTLPDGADMQAVLDKLLQEIPQNYRIVTDMDGVRVDYDDDGWFLVRTSGTEPKVRVFSEGDTKESAQWLNEVAMNGLERAMK